MSVPRGRPAGQRAYLVVAQRFPLDAKRISIFLQPINGSGSPVGKAARFMGDILIQRRNLGVAGHGVIRSLRGPGCCDSFFKRRVAGGVLAQAALN